MMWVARSVVVLPLMLVLSSCEDRKEREREERRASLESMEAEVARMKAEVRQEAFLDAIEEASRTMQTTLPHLITALEQDVMAEDPKLERAAVLVGLHSDEGTREPLVVLMNPVFESEHVSGEIAGWIDHESPIDEGETLRVPISGILDWFTLAGRGQSRGGFVAQEHWTLLSDEEKLIWKSRPPFSWYQERWQKGGNPFEELIQTPCKNCRAIEFIPGSFQEGLCQSCVVD